MTERKYKGVCHGCGKKHFVIKEPMSMGTSMKCDCGWFVNLIRVGLVKSSNRPLKQKKPICGEPFNCLKFSKKCYYSCVISDDFKTGKIAKMLLSDDDYYEAGGLAPVAPDPLPIVY